MRPLTSFGFLLLGLIWFLLFLVKFPAFLLGFILSPILNRINFVVEFIYPTVLGRWFHLTAMNMAQKSRKFNIKDKNQGFHSRATESRIEIVKDRLYLHILPQFLDNLGYLLVSLPPTSEHLCDASDGNTETINEQHKVSVVQLPKSSQIIATVVDCGDADAVMRHLHNISKQHYQARDIHVHSILSTHKHHDHTAGNLKLKKLLSSTLKTIYGGAVEKVPGCNCPLADSDRVPLPQHYDNDMNELATVTAVATPAHTRGSISYILRSQNMTMVFTGDTMFSAGGGVPFEADIDPKQDQKINQAGINSSIRPNAGAYAIERCFTELLARVEGEDAWIMPGHEYNQELLSRQLKGQSEACRWKYYSPAVFFQIASEFFVAHHRRNLPHSDGKLLCAVPSLVSRELIINPHFRTLQKRAETCIHAIRLWYDYFCPLEKNKVEGGIDRKSTRLNSSHT